MSRRRGWGSCIFSFATALVLSQVFFGNANADGPGAGRDRVPVNPVRQSPPDASAVVVQDCMVKFATEINVPAMESGRVAEVNVRLNDAVEKETQIARLEDRTLQIQRVAALGRLRRAQNSAASEAKLRYAKSAFHEAQEEHESSKLTYRDVVGAVSRNQLRRLQLAVDLRQAEVVLAEEAKQDALLEKSLREAELALLEDQRTKLHVESPIAGVIVDVAKSQGEWIDKGDAVATVARVDRLHVLGLVDSRHISPNVCRGLPVSVHWIDPLSGRHRSLQGKVLSVDPRMISGGQFRLHAEIVNQPASDDSSQWQLRPGMDVQMKVFKSAALAHQRKSSVKR